MVREVASYVICDKCGANLEYFAEDIQESISVVFNGYKYIKCPNCENKVLLAHLNKDKELV